MKDNSSLCLLRALQETTLEDRLVKRTAIKRYTENSIVCIYADHLYHKVHTTDHVKFVELILQRSLLDCVLLVHAHKRRYPNFPEEMRETHYELWEKVANRVFNCFLYNPR